MIRFIEHKNIDKQKWDRCVDQSLHPSVHGYSWYLDILCPNWSALVMDDYQAVFPLPIKTKFAIKYLLQPIFMRCTSIYSKSELNEKVVNDFFDAIPQNIKLINIYLKESLPFNRTDYLICKRNVQLLNLNSDYESIKKLYNRSVHKNLRKVERAGFSIVNDVSAGTISEFYKANIGGQIKDLTKDHFDKIEKLIMASNKNGCGITVGVLNANKDIVAISFFMKFGKVIYYLIGGANEEGRVNSAMGFMINEIINRYAQEYEILDFEGSDADGIANFNRNFGAKDFVYLQIRKNTLPGIVKWVSNKK